MKKIIGIVALIGLNTIGIQTASAKIYTCVINGEITYTSRHTGNCEAANLPPIGRYSSSRYDAPQVYTPGAAKPEVKKQQAAVKREPVSGQAASVPAKYTPAAVAPAPKLSGSNSRRSILEQELANERKALSEAQQSLTSARTAKGGTIDQQQITQLQGHVLDRQQNIQALQRELGRM
ncbi:hypothetical protein [Neisseria musculi]|uniref:hypothetical protein n=1 Tax=Neisseria musculi TaxID=1815583 RepID=UPI00164A4529|nr:hypothetical protein [Neisseria musculi]QNT59592.1 hypothetical protein H7A79_0173 [Neisseria musculi]